MERTHTQCHSAQQQYKLFSLWSADNKPIVCRLIDTLTHAEWPFCSAALWYSQSHGWIGARQRRDKDASGEVGEIRRERREKNGGGFKKMTDLECKNYILKDCTELTPSGKLPG